MIGTCRYIQTLALQHNCHNFHTTEVQKMRKLHSPLFCLDGWSLVLRRHGHVCHWIKTMRLRNHHRLWHVCLVGIGVATHLSHLPLGRGDCHCSTNGPSINLSMKSTVDSTVLHIFGSSLCDPRNVHPSIKIRTLCIVWMVGPWCCNTTGKSTTKS